MIFCIVYFFIKTPMVLEDVLDGKCKRVSLYNEKGGVTLVDCSPRLVPAGRGVDFAAARAARTSYGSELKSKVQDERLVRYLVRNFHTSPLEFISFTFKIECPIFVSRQIMRHRTTSINEISARYTVLNKRFFVPERDNIRINNKHNKQSSGSSINEKDKDRVLSMFEASYKHSYDTYQNMLELGVAREIARSVLPVGIFTEFYLTMNLNNLFKFLRLRVAEDCQYETRIVAKAMMELVEPLCPCAFKAWREYSLHSMSLGKHEIEAIKNREKDLNKEASKGEKLTYHKKLQILNIG